MFLAPALSVLAALAFADPPPPPIVNGTATDDYPQAVMLRHATADWRTVYICTGTLIAPNWVLTAAHCLTDVDNEGLTELHVYMGAIWAQGAPEEAADDWFTNPDYSVSPDGSTIVADLGLVHVPHPYDLDGNVLNAIPITNADIGKPYRYVGWGSTSANAYDAGYAKRFADIPLSALEGEFMLGYDPAGSATCGGDSGGPVFELKDGQAGALVAVHSFGRSTNGSGTCEGSTSGDTRVDLYLDWIKANVDVATNADSTDSGTGDTGSGDTGSGNGGGSHDVHPSTGGCATVDARGDAVVALIVGLGLVAGRRRKAG